MGMAQVWFRNVKVKYNHIYAEHTGYTNAWSRQKKYLAEVLSCTTDPWIAYDLCRLFEVFASA